MGNCVAGGGYLPVLCDKLADDRGQRPLSRRPGPGQSAIGQTVGHEDLGGAQMHAAISGTIDFREADEDACLNRVRALVDRCRRRSDRSFAVVRPMLRRARRTRFAKSSPRTAGVQYDVRDLIDVPRSTPAVSDEYKAEFGQTLVCGYGRLGGRPVGVVANQQQAVQDAERGDCNSAASSITTAPTRRPASSWTATRRWTPILFLQNVNGFMVGKDAEQSGIIRAGAKLVNVISNSVVPKITLILGGSFGAGNYALCGKAFDPRFILAWPKARVRGHGFLASRLDAARHDIAAHETHGPRAGCRRTGRTAPQGDRSVRCVSDLRYAAARGWVDEIIEPADTRKVLIESLEIATRHADDEPFRTGVLQV